MALTKRAVGLTVLRPSSSSLTLTTTLPMCLPEAMKRKADSTWCSLKTEVGNGLTAPDLIPSATKETTWFCMASSPSMTLSKRIPWNEVFLRNTDMPKDELLLKSNLPISKKRPFKPKQRTEA
ncbi:hypothetical protein FF38_08025 [Lucilia cuprina]|uniref:Uncharacterized protein n=1 Tax=Lucilia cuprina TaxID=7375 RepID=A0A0L0BRY4_LUCCU|nr:hypothetical protein FF38_08025 [Lucilia cuprina]